MNEQEKLEWWRKAPIGKFWWAVGFCQANHSEWRRGQTTFNVLCDCRPDLSEQIRATDKDAFYRDDRLDVMCTWINEHWSEGDKK